MSQADTSEVKLLRAEVADLLAACRAADSLLNDTTAVRKILRAAIAKHERKPNQ